jgi:hypothetical protein
VSLACSRPTKPRPKSNSCLLKIPLPSDSVQQFISSTYYFHGRACAGKAPWRLIHWRILFLVVCSQPATPPFPSSAMDAVPFPKRRSGGTVLFHVRKSTQTAPLFDGRRLPATTRVWGRPPRRWPWMPLPAQSKFMQAVNRNIIRTKHIDDPEWWVRLWFAWAG